LGLDPRAETVRFKKTRQGKSGGFRRFHKTVKGSSGVETKNAPPRPHGPASGEGREDIMSADTDRTRRGLLLAAATGVVAAGAPALAAPGQIAFADLKKEADVACVYHCDFGDPPRFVQMLTNISNH